MTSADDTPDSAPRKVTVNLAVRAWGALDRVVERTGSTQTEALNRAVQLYEYLDAVIAAGGAVLVTDGADAERVRLRFF